MHTGFIRLAAKARAPVVPVHISAANSALFYFSSMVYRPLSHAAVVHEMFGQRGNSLTLKIGARIPFSSWHDGQMLVGDLAARFRKHVYRLGAGKPGLFHTESSIARAEDRAVLKHALEASEVLGKTPDGKMIYLYRRHGEDTVPILRELGRLREIAFRAVGEGSGRRRDLDGYDDDYFHLVLWDPQALEIVGAYRFIPTADQVASKGRTVFTARACSSTGIRWIRFWRRELTRRTLFSCVLGKRGLDYLWLGIGAYLAKYRRLAICLAGVDFRRNAAARA